jgi:2-methylcitrate dehydratase PrpD
LSSDIGRTNESRVMRQIADQGFIGPHAIIQGEFGFLRVFCNEWDMSELTAVWARRS